MATCLHCARVLTDAEQTGATGDGISRLAMFDCPQCHAKTTVICRQAQIPEGDAVINYKEP